QPSAMNPDRRTSGAKFAVTLAPTTQLVLDLGVDLQRNAHTSRSTMNQQALPFESLARVPDAEFEQTGAFLEADWSLAWGGRVVAGTRADVWRFTDKRQSIALSMMSAVANPLANFEREDTLHSSFIRYEDQFGDSATTWYAGLGHNERFPDYWEITKETAASLVASDSLQAERNTQFDTGLIFRSERFET